MKVALVHDYLHEFGGAERVLATLAEMYPAAPIYTAFAVKGSVAEQRFGGKKIIESWAARIPGFGQKLHSPLRFLAPQIWESFDFSGFDVVISSSSWYMTKGIRVPERALHISYIHTPPRYLYGYATSKHYQKYGLVKIYAGLVNNYLRLFDYETAQKVDVLVANSKEVQGRIVKFWRRDAAVIYPPVFVNAPTNVVKQDYFLTGGRLVGPKHFDVAILAANKLEIPLKVFGTGPEETRLREMAGPTVEFLGKVDEKTLADLYAGATAFLALADDEDFGITPVEAMMCGTPVIAYRGGGFRESVVEGETGVFIDELTANAVSDGIRKLKARKWKLEEMKGWAERFSRERFVRQIKDLVEKEWEKKKCRK